MTNMAFFEVGRRGRGRELLRTRSPFPCPPQRLATNNMIYFSLFTRYILKIISLFLKDTMFYCYVTSNQEYGRRLWRTALFRKREKGDEK
jgi:hypothetical protein